jgi:hypothetical protein
MGIFFIYFRVFSVGSSWIDFSYYFFSLSNNMNYRYLLIALPTKSMKGGLSSLKEVIQKQGFDVYNEEEKRDFIFYRG